MRALAFKAFLWLVVGAAAVVAAFRFVRGLGATTALTDLTPWGFWIGFDVMGGVALAAGGFVVAATVYVFHLERYRPIVRPAVLTAFLGYVAVVVALLFDLGLPWNIWHMIVFWNPHSPLFEVGWCVMLYSMVLALEFGPVILEVTRHPLLQFAQRTLKRFTIPLVILGIMLSTLHQSSLGSLFLIMPYRLPPLWYTPILPVLFFFSAVGLALMMVTLESLISSYLYRKTPEWNLLDGLGRACGYVLVVYGVLRLGDVVVRGELGALLSGSFSGNLFLLELLISTIAPAVLLLNASTRRQRAGIGTAAALVVAGFVMNRLNVGGIATIETTATRYVPSWMEIVVSAGVVAGAALAYLFVAEHFHLFHAGKVDREAFRHRVPEFDPATVVMRPDPYMGGLVTNSLMAVLGAALALAFLPESALAAKTVPPRPVTPPGYAPKIVIDGNRVTEAVAFDHQAHVEREGGVNSCARCHHLLFPGETATGCSRCHRDMYRATSIFDHELHMARLGGKAGCATCHVGDEPKDLRHGKACLSCHTGMVAKGTPMQPKAPPRLEEASGYVAAMHTMCIACHAERAKDPRLAKPKLGECGTCHPARAIPFDPLKPDDRWPR